MNTMVELVAIAIGEKIQPAFTGGPPVTLAAVASAAIEAMREITPAMTKAAFDHPDQIDHQQSNVNDFERQWKSAIDAALTTE